MSVYFKYLRQHTMSTYANSCYDETYQSHELFNITTNHWHHTNVYGVAETTLTLDSLSKGKKKRDPVIASFCFKSLYSLCRVWTGDWWSEEIKTASPEQLSLVIQADGVISFGPRSGKAPAGPWRDSSQHSSRTATLIK